MPGPIQLSIVVPCYNEEQVIQDCALRLRACVDRLIIAGKITEQSCILFVNDGSMDGTWELIESLCSRDPLFAGISLSRNFGHQPALLAGLHAAPGDAVITIDADLQDDPDAIEAMVDRFQDGYDLVFGVRRERKSDSGFKRLTASLFYRTLRFLGADTLSNHADFRLLSRRAIEALRDYREVNLFLRGVVTLIGFPWTTVTYCRTRRLAGKTKYSLRRMFALSLSAVTAFSNVPLRLITAVALLGIIALGAVALWVIGVRLFNDRSAPGWASTLLPILFIGCLNLLAIGIVGEYLARIFDEVKSRPRYIVAAARNLHASALEHAADRRSNREA